MKNAVFWNVRPCGSCKNTFRMNVSSLLRGTGISDLGTTLVVVSNGRTQRRNTCHPEDGGATFLRNIGSYKSHTA
jgi:hypothetical protein